MYRRLYITYGCMETKCVLVFYLSAKWQKDRKQKALGLCLQQE